MLQELSSASRHTYSQVFNSSSVPVIRQELDVSGDPHDFMLSYTNLNKNSALYRKVTETIDDLKKDRVVGLRLKKEQIPQYYVKKHDVNAVYKVDLPGYWRLIYGILSIHGERKALLMELFDHNRYNKRFGY